MEKFLVSKFNSRRSARFVLRRLHKSLKPEYLRALNAFVNEKDEILVGAVLGEKVPVHIEVFVQTILGEGQKVEMTLDEYIEASLKAKETYIGIASKIFPAVTP